MRKYSVTAITAARPPRVEPLSRVRPCAHRRETFLMPRALGVDQVGGSAREYPASSTA
jgi:hypothetical protein